MAVPAWFPWSSKVPGAHERGWAGLAPRQVRRAGGEGEVLEVGSSQRSCWERDESGR